MRLYLSLPGGGGLCYDVDERINVTARCRGLVLIKCWFFIVCDRENRLNTVWQVIRLIRRVHFFLTLLN